MLKETQKIFLDSCRYIKNTVTIKQNDTRTRFLEIHFSCNRVPMNLTSCSVQAVLKKPDKKIIFSQAQITDAENGTAELALTKQTLALSGEILAEVSVYGTSGELLSSMPFSINVIGTLIDERLIESTDEFSALTDALTKVNDFSLIADSARCAAVAAQEAAKLAGQIVDGSVPDGKVTATKLADAAINVFNPDDITEGYINESGVITPSPEGSRYVTTHFIPVSAGQNYTVSSGSGRGYAFYDSDKSYIPNSRVQIDTGYGGERTFTVPDIGARFLRLQVEISESTLFQLESGMICFGSVLPEKYVPYGASIDWLHPSIKKKSIGGEHLGDGSVSARNVQSAGTNLFDTFKKVKGYINGGGSISTDTDMLIYTSDFMPVSENEAYTFSAGSARGYAFYDSDKNYIPDSRVQVDAGYGGVKTITVPKNGAKYIRIQTEDKPELEFFIDKFMFCIGAPLPERFLPFGTNVDWLKPANALSGKTLCVIGDSIAAASPWDGVTKVYGMFERAADENGMILKSCAVNGATVAVKSGSTNNLINQLSSLPAQTDYLIIEGGLNDIWTTPLGSISDSFSGATDNSTFCGALEYLLRYVLVKYPEAKIGFMTTHKIPGAYPLKKFMTAAVKICKKYSVPVLDMHENSGLCTELSGIKEAYFLPGGTGDYDGVHPNTRGYAVFARRVSAFLQNMGLGVSYSPAEKEIGTAMLGDGAVTLEKLDPEAIRTISGLGGMGVSSWEEVQKIVRAGLAGKVFNIGDRFTCKRGEETLTWDVIGFDCDVPSDVTKTHSMTLQLHDCLSAMQFDAPEALYYAAEELPAGTYNFTLLAGYDLSYGGGKTFSFTLKNPVPQGGVIMFPWAYNTQSANTKISTYETVSSTAAIETVPVTEGAAGTPLESTNHTHRIRFGSNNWSESAVRQFINSAAPAGSAWEPKTVYDRPPSWASSAAGFLNGLDEDFLAVIGEVKKVTALNAQTGGSEATAERFFLLSRSEVYGGIENGISEGEPYPYYKDNSTLSAAGTGADANRAKCYADGTPTHWWNRSPDSSTFGSVRIIQTTGASYGYIAYGSLGIAPACCIV